MNTNGLGNSFLCKLWSEEKKTKKSHANIKSTLLPCTGRKIGHDANND